MGEHVTFNKRLHSGAVRPGHPKDPADELGESAQIAVGGEAAQHIRERTVPPLLERLLRDNDP
ncbi:MAG: hypothetical protein ACRD1G_10560, partial [Acidimicrobiales bacterium]